MGLIDQDKLKDLMKERGYDLEYDQDEGSVTRYQVWQPGRKMSGSFDVFNDSFERALRPEDKDLEEQATEYLTPQTLTDYFCGPYQELRANPGNVDAKNQLDYYREQAKQSGDLTSRQIKAAEERAKKEVGM